MKPTIFFAMSVSLRVQAAARLRLPVSTDCFTSSCAGLAHVRPLDCQAFSTCAKSSSTGVERPKIVTDTRSLLFS